MLLSREKIEAEYQKKLEQFQTESAIRGDLSSLPFREPDFIHQNDLGFLPTVLWDIEREPDSMQTAVDMVDLFGDRLDIECRRGYSRTIRWKGCEMPDHVRGEPQWEVEEGIILDQHAYSSREAGFSASLEFYPVALNVKIEIRFFLPHELRSYMTCRYSPGGQVIRSTIRPHIHRVAMHFVQYAGGDDMSMHYVSVMTRDEMRRNLLGEP